MDLMTAAQRDHLLANGRRHGRDHPPVIKLFSPVGAATWLVSEIDPERPSVAFGLADLGFGHPELGCFSLDEMRELTLPGGLGIERDLHFDANGIPMSRYADAARAAGHIVDRLPEA